MAPVGAAVVEGEASGKSSLPRAVEWGRHVAVALVLATLAFMQEPGRIVPDTKVDLVLNPLGLLTRALSLWEPLGFAGQVQNQGYGYLFPMGPFFLVGDLVNAPEWIWQRLWWSLLLFTAYLGTYLLAKALGVGSPGTRILAGLAFALAPRVVASIGAISSETLPVAISPWVLLPLVWAARDGRWARGGLFSGVALLLAGGVNAAATLVLCIPPALYLLTRAPGRSRRRLTAWWALGSVLACAWWLGPLVLLRAVSPPFLDYIEDASVTTRFSSLPQAIRGAEHWLGYLADTSGPVWRSGWFLVTVPVVILYTVVVAGLGLTGMALRSLPERAFITALALVGLLLLTFGYVGSVDGLLAETARNLLDGPLVAFRNTHKFDPVLRMAIALGLAHVLARAFAFARGREGWGIVPYAVAALALLGVAGTAFPAYVGQLASRGSFASVPDYWVEASDYLEQRTTDGGRALLVPGTPFANYLWGAPRDEPLQALGRVPWLVRDAIPLTPPATIRMLDALQARWASGRESPGVADQLAAAGVKFLVIRNDLDTAAGRAPSPSVVHEALRGSSGLRLVADFGPLVGGQLDDGAVVDRGLSQPYRAVEVYEVMPYAGLVSTSPMSSVPVVVGGPENVVDLRDAGIIDAAPALLDGDGLAEATGPLIQTDGIARRESTPGRVDDNSSARLTVDEDGVLGRRVLDYRVFPDDRATAPARWMGEGVVTASSSSSQVNSTGGARRSASPAAGLDGDLFTAWWPALGIQEPTWWQVAWPTPRVLPALRIAIDDAIPPPRARAIEVSTSGGVAEYAVPESGIVEVPAGSLPTDVLRISPLGPAGTRLGLREIVGLPPERRTAVVPVPSRAPDVTALTSSVDGRPWCVHPPAAVICTDLIGRSGEEDGSIDRIAALPAGDPLMIEVRAVPRPGSSLDALVAKADTATGGVMVAAASSSGVADPEGGPRAAIDRDLETAWIARSTDNDPRLALEWGTERPVAGLQLRQRLGAPISRPISASVRFPGGEVRSGRFDDRGLLVFDAPVRAASMTVSFPLVQDVFSVDPATGSGVVLPVGITDLRVLGAIDLQPDSAVSTLVEIPCGEGPALTIGNVLLPTEGETNARDLVQRRPATFTPCGVTAGEPTTGGTVRVLATGGDRWSVQQVIIGDVTIVDQAPEVQANVTTWGSTARSVAVPARDEATLLVVRENANSGWAAYLDGAELTVARPDGWQQGWVMPPGEAGTVELRMRAGPWYQAALVLGLVCALVLVVGAGIAARRRPGAVESGGSLRPWDVPPLAGWLFGGVVMVSTAGVWGAVAWASTWVMERWLPVRMGRLIPVAVGILALAAGLLLAMGAWPVDYSGDSLAPALAITWAVALAASPRVAVQTAEPPDVVTGVDTGLPGRRSVAPEGDG